jgi:hypothetical protein
MLGAHNKSSSARPQPVRPWNSRKKFLNVDYNWIFCKGARSKVAIIWEHRSEI